MRLKINALRFSVVAILCSGAQPHVSFALSGLQVIPTAITTPSNQWVEPDPNKVVLSAGCKVTESFNSVSFERDDYVQCPGFAKPHRFYRHHRVIGALISGNHDFVLVNDDYATKSSRVVLVDLVARRERTISAVPMRAYKRDVPPDPRIIVQPEGYRFSDDDKFVLMMIGPTSYSVSSRAGQKRLEREAQTRWYMVSTSEGNVVRQYRGSQPPF